MRVMDFSRARPVGGSGLPFRVLAVGPRPSDRKRLGTMKFRPHTLIKQGVNESDGFFSSAPCRRLRSPLSGLGGRPSSFRSEKVRNDEVSATHADKAGC